MILEINALYCTLARHWGRTITGTYVAYIYYWVSIWTLIAHLEVTPHGQRGCVNGKQQAQSGTCISESI